MGKIWIKSSDPSHRCCGCAGKTGPCSSCCITLLPNQLLEGGPPYATRAIAQAHIDANTSSCAIAAMDIIAQDPHQRQSLSINPLVSGATFREVLLDAFYQSGNCPSGAYPPTFEWSFLNGYQPVPRSIPYPSGLSYSGGTFDYGDVGGGPRTIVIDLSLEPVSIDNDSGTFSYCFTKLNYETSTAVGMVTGVRLSTPDNIESSPQILPYSGIVGRIFHASGCGFFAMGGGASSTGFANLFGIGIHPVANNVEYTLAGGTVPNALPFTTTQMLSVPFAGNASSCNDRFLYQATLRQPLTTLDFAFGIETPVTATSQLIISIFNSDFDFITSQSFVNSGYLTSYTNSYQTNIPTGNYYFLFNWSVAKTYALETLTATFTGSIAASYPVGQSGPPEKLFRLCGVGAKYTEGGSTKTLICNSGTL